MNEIRFKISIVLKKYNLDLFGSVISIHYFVNEFFDTNISLDKIKFEVGNMIALQYNYGEVPEVEEDFEMIKVQHYDDRFRRV